MPDQTAIAMAENLGKQGPALSATSDMPVIDVAAATEVSAPAVAVVEAKATTAEPTEATVDGEKTGTDETPPWMKREITIERNKRREAETKSADATARLDEALKALQIRTGEDPNKTTQTLETTDPRPTREQFDAPDAYDDALIEWSSSRAASTALAQDTQKRIQTEQTHKMEEVRTAWEGRRQQALKDIPDYEAVAESNEVQISVPMANTIMMSPQGPALAYHLGKNIDVAKRIASLPPGDAIYAMGFLASELQTKKIPEISNAPAPHKPLGARANALSKTPQEESMDEYAARRTRELRAKPH